MLMGGKSFFVLPTNVLWGDDLLYGGTGADTFCYAAGDGKDLLQNADKNDMLYLYNITNLKTGFNYIITYRRELYVFIISRQLRKLQADNL